MHPPFLHRYIFTSSVIAYLHIPSSIQSVSSKYLFSDKFGEYHGQLDSEFKAADTT